VKSGGHSNLLMRTVPLYEYQKAGFLGLFAFVVLIASFSRGLVPLLSGKASLANISYDVSAVLGMSLAFIGIGFCAPQE